MGERGASGEGSARGRSVGALILSGACSGAGRRAGPSATAGAVGRTVGGRGEKVTTVGRWQLGHLGRPGAMEWFEAQGEPGGSFSFFSACFSLLYFLSFIYFLSVLFHFRAFRYFVKLCPLHHNYLCNIWQPPNIFVLTLENFCCLTCLEF